MSEYSGRASVIWPLVGWGAACILVAFHIPKFDMGFDGIKVYLILAAFMLAVVFAVRAFLLPAQ